jgi:hypothetical protein
MFGGPLRGGGSGVEKSTWHLVRAGVWGPVRRTRHLHGHPRSRQ